MRRFRTLVVAPLCIGLALVAGLEPASAQGVKPIPVIPKTPQIPVGVGSGASVPTTTPTIPRAQVPTATPIPVIVVPPVAQAQAAPVMACPLTNLGDSYSNSCEARLIDASTVLQRLAPCNDGVCYAARIIELTSSPAVIVSYPAEPARRAELRRAIMKEIAYSVEYMGATLKERARQGVSGLPSSREIDDLITRARSEVDAIDQPIDETPEQRRQRLGLGPAKQRMARLIRNS